MSVRSLPKTVVLFGAGASYGAGGIQPSTPPLGHGLFHEVVREYPKSWGRLDPNARALFENEGFEAGMEWVWRNRPEGPQILHKDLGDFFCRFSIGDAANNAYVHLLRAIAEREAGAIMLATLNYEMVLEEAASIAGLSWSYGDTLCPGYQVLIAKPHGSCNFISKSLQINNLAGNVRLGTGVAVNGTLKPLWRREALAYCSDPKNALGPAIAAFMRGKPSRICPTVLRDMQAAFQTAVMEAKKVAVVGVNPHVADAHIWDCLAQTSADLAFCGDDEAFQSWVKNYRFGAPTSYLGPYFADAVDELTQFIV